MEYYVTLFDDKFLPQGMVLHHSLLKHGGSFQLCILAMSANVAQQLRELALPNTKVIPLDEVETPELRRLKLTRSWAEFCYTATPFSVELVFSLFKEARRVTYLDADVCLFQSPEPFFGELDAANKQVLITEHAFAPELAHLGAGYGQFCVQFLTFCRDDGGSNVCGDWLRQCLNGTPSALGSANSGFSDQSYLEDWPLRYPEAVHVLQQREQTLAPWNLDYYTTLAGRPYYPVLYHFHGFRIIRSNLVQVSTMFSIKHGKHLYADYVNAVKEQCRVLESRGIPRPVIPLYTGPFWWFWLLKRCMFQKLKVCYWPRQGLNAR